jgi:hypothetical protein
MAVQEFRVGTQSSGVTGRRIGGFLQTLARLHSIAFALQLPDFTGRILCGNPHSRSANK